jgi:hypothetical protein
MPVSASARWAIWRLRVPYSKPLVVERNYLDVSLEWSEERQELAVRIRFSNIEQVAPI